MAQLCTKCLSFLLDYDPKSNSTRCGRRSRSPRPKHDVSEVDRERRPVHLGAELVEALCNGRGGGGESAFSISRPNSRGRRGRGGRTTLEEVERARDDVAFDLRELLLDVRDGHVETRDVAGLRASVSRARRSVRVPLEDPHVRQRALRTLMGACGTKAARRKGELGQYEDLRSARASRATHPCTAGRGGVQRRAPRVRTSASERETDLSPGLDVLARHAVEDLVEDLGVPRRRVAQKRLGARVERVLRANYESQNGPREYERGRRQGKR